MQEVTPGQVGLTVGLAMVSAIGFLLLRCQGKGRPFGPAGRRLAVAIVMLTGLVSASVALVGGIVLDQYLSTLLGAVAPSGLWFSQVRAGEPERRTVGKEMATFWLVSLLARLDQAMAEDQRVWCERRVDDSWSVYELSLAAIRYHERICDRLAPEQRRRERVHARLEAIERRLDVAALIEDGASRSKVVTALGGSRHTKLARYERYLHDLTRLHGILRHDAENDLLRLLASAYRAGHRSLPRYVPPSRSRTVIEPVSPHP
ncbi:hypothetical protein [Nonomuraea cavernae]|uniref:Uncharacterized protein n=1 Tax=Nonomuraea cavernae TaxID=2045107 RepID=A0A917Z018_9ACTN|nr:hypothetical protein [Nonomuraea cavernae]MCA2186528.1 hypothetical protein [Nonomuraea cavernae]GGO71355.1 hypothetical protein GCM10012289_36890 [Nonomuraea cavernae]